MAMHKNLFNLFLKRFYKFLKLSLNVFLCAVSLQTICLADNALAQLERLPTSALLLIDETGREVYAKNIDRPMIPASTVKLLTALVALQTLGSDYRFKTEFYWHAGTQDIWIRGLGDPYLVSEELDLIAQKIVELDLGEVNGIGVDVSFFAKDVDVSGRRDSNNPYDAPVSALAVNFNTVKINVQNGKISSGETQTPLTQTAKLLGENLINGTHRVNLGLAQRGPIYFAELLSFKLNEVGLFTNADVVVGEVPVEANLVYTHDNSRALSEVIAAMLQYSNNFIASQLYLTLGAEYFGAPVTTNKAKQFFDRYIEQHFQWQDYALYDGAGLSRRNQLTAKHLIEILSVFKPYRALLPTQSSIIRAKTGTLKNVSTYAGYVKRQGSWSSFALLINQPVAFGLREQIAQELSGF